MVFNYRVDSAVANVATPDERDSNWAKLDIANPIAVIQGRRDESSRPLSSAANLHLP